jgi:riboflavin kinase/FMN adenylyltransferase
MLIPAPGTALETFMNIQHYRSLEEVSLQNAWLTVGVFDGVHRGHQEILKRLTTGAHAMGAPAVVLTFHPHPAKVFGRGDIKLLTLPDERAKLFGEMGVDVVITHPFNRDVANISAQDFMMRLKEHLGLKHLVLGYDSALGKNREGNIPRLTKIGQELGYVVEVVPALSDESGVISSTEIRKLISTGNVEEAARLMGHPYGLHGPIIHGEGRGKEIQVPTANIDYSSEKMIPANGIYAGWMVLQGERNRGAISVGFNPTFTPNKLIASVEVHILDFEREIYGQDVRLEFVARLRDELKFDSVTALVEQISKDVEQTKTLLR